MTPLLKIKSLKTYFPTKAGCLMAVNGVDLEINTGETVALVGESGSGKSITALSIFRLVPAPGRILEGVIRFNGQNLLSLSKKEMRRIRGKQMGFIMQDPLSSLNPLISVGEQIAEVMRTHDGLTRKQAKQQTIDLMYKVQLPDAERSYGSYPHQLSGGQRQRIVIAIALACRPQFIVADEPTTALDVSIQSQILELLMELKNDFQISLLLITHDLGIIANIADRVAVMYAGKIVEEAPTKALFTNPLHPYTEALLQAIPRIDFSQEGNNTTPPTLKGNPPDLINLPSGCAFHPRCCLAESRCKEVIPENYFIGKNRYVKCIHSGVKDGKNSKLFQAPT